jgi:hypothetical protein
MSGRIIFQPTRNACASFAGCAGRPKADAYPAGTLWECDDCHKQWVVVTGAQYNEPYSAWRDAGQPTIFGEFRGAGS